MKLRSPAGRRLIVLTLSLIKAIVSVGQLNLDALTRRLANRDPGRTEANVQSDLHALLLAAPLELDEHDLRDLEVVLEQQAGARRRIDVEAGLCVLSGNTMSKDWPDAMQAFQRSMTVASSSGWCTLCQPQPCMCSKVEPVYSYHRRLYQVILPSASAIQTSWGMALASVSKRSSDGRSLSKGVSIQSMPESA